MAIDERQVARATEERLSSMRPFEAKARPIPAEALPPGPRWPALLQGVALMRFRHSFVPAMHRRYGDTFTIRLIPDGRPLVLFSRPEHARAIFAGDPESFHAGKGNAILGPVMGRHSLLLQDSTEHARSRRLLMPAFNGAALRRYSSLVTEVAREQVGTWRGAREISALDRMNALTLEVILRVVFGVADEQRLARLRPLVRRTVSINPAILLGWGYPWLQRFGPWKATVDVQRALDLELYAIIAQRREQTRSEPDGERSDVLAALLAARDESGDGLSDDEVRDQLITLLLAGHETTASALAWSLHELGRHPDLLERARAAADGEGGEDDDVLEAVLKESMRLHPVIPMVVRHLMAPASIGEWDLPAGTNVGPSIILSHAREASFPEPKAFRPDRFLGQNPAPHTWIPFGGGVRRCIGAGFSLMEGVAVLREVLRTYDVSVAPGRRERVRVRNITSVPRHGARVRLTPR